MASNISLGIIIGASLNGSVGSAFNSVSRQAQQLGQNLERVRLARNAGRSVLDLRDQLRSLMAQQQAAGGSNTALAADIERVKNELKAARRAAREQGLELHNLEEETRRLEQTEARLNRQLQRQQTLDNNRNRRAELQGQIMGVVALGAALAMPVKTAMELEHRMAELGSVTHESTAALEKQARQLGRDTSFDALGAADAQIALAKAGMDSQKVLAATPVVLGIAAASQMQLGETAELTAEIMGGYNIKMERMGEVADILVKTANLSTTSVRDIGESLKYVGGVASAVNVSFEQTNGMLAALSNNAIKGSQAGTALRMGFLRLAQAPKKAQEAMERLGISIKDAKGNFRDIPTILKELDRATLKMGSADRLATYGNIFGAESSTAFLQLGKSATSGELDKMIAKVKDSKGFAKATADEMQNSTKGALERLGGSFSELGIVIGNVLLPHIRKAADYIGGLADIVSVAGEKYPKYTNAIVGTVAALLVFKVVSLAAAFGMTLLSDAVVFGKAVFDFFRLSTMQANIALVKHKVTTFALAVQQKALAASTAVVTAAQWLWNAAITANPLGLLVIGIAAVAVAVIKYWQPIKAFALGMWEGLKIGLAPVLEALAPLQPIFSMIGAAIGGLVSWLGQLFTPLNASKAELAAASEAGKNFGIVVGTAITSLIYIVGQFGQAVINIGTAIGQAVAVGVSYFSQLYNAAVGLVSGFFSIGAQIMDGLLGGLSAGFARVKAQVLGMASSIASSFKGVLGIHSPSRVFAELGGYINEGLQVGLVESKNKPIGESLKIAELMAQGFKVDTSGVSVGVPASQGRAAATAGSPIFNITINQQPGENANDLVERVMAKIQQMTQLQQRGALYDF
jgi:TP901 family phage tail tape measure protein